MESDRRGHVTGRAPTYLINGLNTVIMGETKTGNETGRLRIRNKIFLVKKLKFSPPPDEFFYYVSIFKKAWDTNGIRLSILELQNPRKY
jgi:hypothetical protein